MIENFKAFLTGSHAYGIPRHDSDIDLVILVSEKDLEKLRVAMECSGETHDPDDPMYIAAGGVPLRFGPLNLIACTNEAYFAAWRKGTWELKKRKPVPRDFAVEYMRRVREELGLTSDRS